MLKTDNSRHTDSTFSREQSLNRYTWFLLSAWTITMTLVLVADLSFITKTTNQMALAEAETLFNRDNAIRSWIAANDGIYIATNETIQPSPYLAHIPDRDVTTPSGRQLTLMNPTLVLRTFHEYSHQMTDVTGHITSLEPLRPENSPYDQWERTALQQFEEGSKEQIEFVDIDHKPFLRLMRPLIVAQECLSCHARQGYHEGDIRGGITINVPMAPFLKQEREYVRMTTTTLLVLWLLGIAGILCGNRGLRRQIYHRDLAEQEVCKYRDNLEVLVEERTCELEESLKNVKLLRGMLPICARCKKIRDDQGYWNQLEAYIGKHSDATFSHGICPDCATQLFPKDFQNNPSSPDSSQNSTKLDDEASPSSSDYD